MVYLTEDQPLQTVPYFAIDQNESFKFGGPKLYPSTKALIAWLQIAEIRGEDLEVPLLLKLEQNRADFASLGLTERASLNFTHSGHPCVRY